MTDALPELLPCPFCGHDTINVYAGRAECDRCEARVHGEDNADAIAAWNRRSVPGDVRAAFQVYVSDDLLRLIEGARERGGALTLRVDYETDESPSNTYATLSLSPPQGSVSS